MVAFPALQHIMNFMKFMALISSLLILSIACFSGCRKSDSPSMKVAVVGIDGATWEMIDLLISQNQLPAFSRLKKKGAWGNLETILPTESVSIWTSIATGMSPEKHGIQTFTRRIRGTDKTVPSPGTDRRVPAIWNIASDAGKKVACVKWFATWPAEPVNGIMLSPRLEPEDSGLQTYPLDLFKEISPLRYQSSMHTIPKVPKEISGAVSTVDFNSPGILKGKNTNPEKMFDDTSVWVAGKYVQKKLNPDLFMIYFKSIDRIEHFLWGTQSSLSSPEASDFERKGAECLSGWYRYFDSILTELMQDPDQLLFVMSDHGMESTSQIHEPYDIHYIDLDLLLRALGYQMPGTGTTTDWADTQAYVIRSLPYQLGYQLNLNIANREPQGIVPMENSENIRKELNSSLLQLKTLTDKPVFTHFASDSMECDLYCQLNSELTLGDSIRLGKIIYPLRNFLNTKSLPRGIHTKAPAGIFIAWGPGIRNGQKLSGAHVFDITPTVLYALDLPVASDFDGKCLSTIFTDEFRSKNPVREIPSYGTRLISSPLVESKSDTRAINELKALGYL
jgi:predicted AlkP superfamily phosphohydrolase/phosphomutase